MRKVALGLLKSVTIGLLFVLLALSITVTVFSGMGTLWLHEEGMLFANAEERQKEQEDIEFKASLLSELEWDLGIKLEQYFHTDDEDLIAERNEILSKRLARKILEIGLSDGWASANSFAEKYHVKFSAYHYLGQPLYCNMKTKYEADADKHIIVNGGNSYPVYVLFDSHDLESILIVDERLQTFWIRNRSMVVSAFVAGLIISELLWAIISFMLRSGKEREEAKNWLPLEIPVAAGIAGLWFLLYRISEIMKDGWPALWNVVDYWLAFVGLALLLLCYLSWRTHKKNWTHCTLSYWVYTLIKKWIRHWKEIFENLSLTWKWILLELLISAAELVLIFAFVPPEENGKWFLCAWGALRLLIMPWIIRYGIFFGRIRKATAEMAQGRLDYQLETGQFPASLRGMAEDVNAMAGSVSVAVEERLKSEKLKTELITNVSHDIKTPLTSIINFSDLIEREKTENPKITEYAEHLHAQSTRLKKLIEDLIEASKASTGNLVARLEECDVRILLGQCLGEYENRLKEKGLELVLKQSDRPLRIMADPRMLWRVFDNLMNNVCKYSQKETRVYLSAEQVEGHARILFKNVSKYALDVSPEELLERFVRGDLSRHTEGYGLGLSIVRSLMELQGGKISIDIDADLFKVMLEFPLAPKQDEEKDCTETEKKV